MFDIIIYKCASANIKFNTLLKPSSNDNPDTKSYTLLRYRNLECEIIADYVKYYKTIPHECFAVNTILVQVNKRIEITEYDFPNINRNDYDQVITGDISVTDKYYIINTCHSTFYKIMADEYDPNSIIPKDIL